MDRFAQAIAKIDEANSADPNREEADGAALPKELLYGQRMSAWLARLRPDAPEALRLAVRAQHIRRWERPRSEYPMDRIGYLTWRKQLYKFHADTAAEILQACGYDDETIDRVRFLLLKKSIAADPDSQSLEDCACLVFLEFHFAEFARRTDTEKMIGILQKTWKKMSPAAHAAALALPMPDQARALVQEALGGG